jgi:hypothetical protein
MPPKRSKPPCLENSAPSIAVNPFSPTQMIARPFTTAIDLDPYRISTNVGVYRCNSWRRRVFEKTRPRL